MRLFSFDPPDGGKTSGRDLATIAIVHSLPDAAVMQATLRAYGIPSYALGYQLSSVDWYWLMALGGIAISVPASLKDEAIALIPDLAAPRNRKEITAEIRATGGPYARKRLITAHLILPLGTLLVNLPYLLSFFFLEISEGWLELPGAIIGTLVALALLFLSPF